MVCLSEFWKWAEQNRHWLDFSKMKKNILGKEPEWVDEQRERDFNSKKKFRKDKWTIAEEEKLKFYLNQYKYNCPEMSNLMNRTEGAIARRAIYLGLKAIPLRASSGNKWENWQLEKLKTMIVDGYSYSAIGKVIGKSEKATRGKTGAIWGTETADKVRNLIKTEAKNDKNNQRKTNTADKRLLFWLCNRKGAIK